MWRSLAAGRHGAVRRVGVLVAAAGATLTLGHLPMTSAAFTATTGNAGNAFAAAASWCTPGGVTKDVVNDTYVQEKDPNNNYGSDNTLEVRSHTNDDRRVFVRPDLPSVPAGCTLQSAMLTFTVTGFKGGRTYDVYRVAAQWDVGSITWSNQPGVTGSPASANTKNNVWDVDVVAQIQAIMAAGQNYGLMVRDSVEDGAQDNNNKYASIDSGDPPRVVYTWA